MKEVEVKPERARGLGVITPTLHTMQVEYPNENYQDVRVVRTQGANEVWYRGMNRHTMNLNKGDLPTEIIIPRSTVFFSDTNPYQDALEFNVKIKNTDINVSQGKVDLYISRETGTDANPSIVVNRILVHSFEIHGTEDIQLLITDLDHWDWVVGAMQALHQNPFTGYTLYVEYQDDHDLYKRSTAKSKIGLISYNTEVHSTIRFTQEMGTIVREIYTEGVTEHVDGQNSALFVPWMDGDTHNTPKRRIMLGYNLYSHANNLLEGLKVDVIVTDPDASHTLQVPKKDGNGNVVTDGNGDPVMIEQTFAPGQPIDSYGDYAPAGQTASTQNERIWSTPANIYTVQGKWTWTVPDDFLIEATMNYPHMVRVDFVIGRNAQTYYGSTNPLTQEVEHPNMDTKYGSTWTFWLRIESENSSSSGGGNGD